MHAIPVSSLVSSPRNAGLSMRLAATPPDGVRTFSATQTLSTAIEAWEPDIAAPPDGSS